MRVLLTGHHGYIGAVLGPMLAQAGHEVVGVDSGLFAGSCFGARPAEIFPSIQTDIRDLQLDDLQGYDAILHLAGLSNDPLGDLNPELTMEINYRASVRLARLAKQAGVPRFLFSSSCSNYGAAGDDFLTEESAFNPVTPYGRSKVLVEQAVSLLADDTFSPTFLRSATAYGVSPFLRFDLVLNNLVAWAMTTGRIYMKSDGTPWRPIVHIEDIARAFLAVLHAPRERVHNEAFNVGRTAENYRVRELAEIVAETVPNCRIEYAPDAGPDRRNYRVNCDKILRVLPEFQPQWDARTGARQLYAAYQQTSISTEDFEGPRYKRIAHLKQLLSTGRIDAALRWKTAQQVPAPQQFSMPFTLPACRSCGGERLQTVLSLGNTPLADRLLTAGQLDETEPASALDLLFCPDCSLAQISVSVAPEILFGEDYPYFSSVSTALLEHFGQSAAHLITARRLDSSSLVIEAASNDGYMLQNFKERGIPVLGIDPARGPVEAARSKGIPTLLTFFTRELAGRLRAAGQQADVFLANNVLAHVPDLNGFVEGIRILLKPNGMAVIECPYVVDLVDHCEFDTIYHQHLCYFSVTALDALFRRHQLYLNAVQRTPIHGGSLRLFIEPHEAPQESVTTLL